MHRLSGRVVFVPVVVLSIVSLGLVAAARPLAASGFGIFQHDGPGTAEVGALTARAGDPSALTYNPAGITALPGLQIEFGLDLSNAKDSYESVTAGRFQAHHVINFPPNLYLTYRLKDSPFAFGLGIDSPDYYTQNWDPVFFPGRFLNRRFELKAFELHPVLAYDLGDGWSAAGGLRYGRASLMQGDSVLTTTPGLAREFEVARTADGNVDGFSFDLGLRYAQPAWGFGAVYRHDMKLTGSGAAHYRPRDVDTTQAPFSAFNVDLAADQSWTLPREVRGGIWIAPYPELRIELDVSDVNWSAEPDSAITYRPDLLAPAKTITPRNWKDALNFRLGLEGNLTDELVLQGGLGFEQSPVPRATLDPTFPRGDAWVAGFGFSYNFPAISFDLAISFHRYQQRAADHQELLSPDVTGAYRTQDKLFGASIRWRL
jgi:long-chain fatty acid transport protein